MEREWSCYGGVQFNGERFGQFNRGRKVMSEGQR